MALEVTDLRYPVTRLDLSIVRRGGASFVRQYVSRKVLFYVSGLSTLVVVHISETLVPKLMQWFLDLLSGSRVPGWLSGMEKHLAVRYLLLALVATLLVQFVMRRAWRLTLGQETIRLSGSLRTAVWNVLRYVPIRRVETDLNPGVVMNVATSDINAGRMNFGWSLVSLFDTVSLGLFTLGAMLWIDWRISLWALIPVSAMPFLLHRLARLEAERHDAAQDQLSRLNELCAQAVGTTRLQRITNTEEFWYAKLLAIADRYRQLRLRVVETDLSFWILAALVPIVGLAVVLWMSFDRVMTGQLTVGEFLAFQSYLLILQGPVTEIGYSVSEWQRGITSLDRVCDVLQQKPAIGFGAESRGKEESAARSSTPVEIRELSFRYPADEKPILDRFSLSLAPGERVGICGPIGAGKSTLLKILIGIETEYDGTVRIFGEDARTGWHVHRERIAFVPQRAFLFADSVRFNLRLDRDFAEDELWAALELAGLADEVRRFPGGLDAQLGEWGINLSGGQKQRLTLARAVLRKPELLLLDDCVSAVDTVTEEHIVNSLNKVLGATTVLWVAHRRSTLRFCNRIVEMGV